MHSKILDLLSKNQMFVYNMKSTVSVESLSFGGEGISRIDGKVCFVTGALPGEIVEIDIFDNKKSFSRARTINVIKESPERIVSKCPYSFHTGTYPKYCDGCAYQHLTYEAEVNFKHKQFFELLTRLGKINDCNIKPPIHANQPLYYRNKIIFHTKKGLCGYFANDNKSIVPIKECLLATSEINNAIKNFVSTKVNDKDIIFRYTERDGVIIIDDKNKLNKNKILIETTDYGIFKVNIGSFFQVNIKGLNLLMKEVSDILETINNRIVIDCYSGVGIFGILAAKKGFTSYFTDIDEQAITMAKLNASECQLKDSKFLSGYISNVFSLLSKGTKGSDCCLILDPPRTGLDKDFFNTICSFKPADIIYISCAPDTLCRDLKELKKNSYEIESTRIIDMFPRTKHFETVTHLQLKKHSF